MYLLYLRFHRVTIARYGVTISDYQGTKNRIPTTPGLRFPLSGYDRVTIFVSRVTIESYPLLRLVILKYSDAILYAYSRTTSKSNCQFPYFIHRSQQLRIVSFKVYYHYFFLQIERCVESHIV